MSLSEDESEYIDLVRERAPCQIDSNVWEGIQRDRLTHWLGSLKNIDAELLGAYLLDNLCYRSRSNPSQIGRRCPTGRKVAIGAQLPLGA